jgi:hypothetical protein
MLARAGWWGTNSVVGRIDLVLEVPHGSPNSGGDFGGGTMANKERFPLPLEHNVLACVRDG